MPRSARRPAPKAKKVAPVYAAPVGKNSPSAIIRLASGAPYKATKKKVARPIRRGR